MGTSSEDQLGKVRDSAERRNLLGPLNIAFAKESGLYRAVRLDLSGGGGRFGEMTTAVLQSHGEQRDLVTKFLTLVSATLVLSVGFADGIVDEGSWEWLQVSALSASWVLLVASLILLGVGLLYLHSASVQVRRTDALREPHDWWPHQRRSAILFLMSGSVYVLALMVFCVAGLIGITSHGYEPGVPSP